MQHQFGATLGGPIQRSKTFLFAGYDQHIFDLPAVVEFDNGSTTVVPQLGMYPTFWTTRSAIRRIGGSACDQAIVPGCPPPSEGGPPCVAPTALPAAAQLSQNGGTFPAKLLGETGSLKLDRVLTPHQFLSARVSTARSYGTNNVSFDSGSPITNYAMSGNGEEDVATESASLSLSSSITPRLTSHLRAQFSRDLEQSFPNTTGVRTSIYGWMEDLGQSSTLPRQTREHRLHLAETLSLSRGRNQWKFGADGMRTWDYNYFPSLFGGRVLSSTTFRWIRLRLCRCDGGAEFDAAAGVCAHNHAELELGCWQLDWAARQPGALLRCRISGIRCRIRTATTTRGSCRTRRG